MLLRISRFPIPIMLVALLAVTACGGSDESTGWDLLRSSDESAGHLGAPGVAGGRQVCRGRQQHPQQERLRPLGK